MLRRPETLDEILDNLNLDDVLLPLYREWITKWADTRMNQEILRKLDSIELAIKLRG